MVDYVKRKSFDLDDVIDDVTANVAHYIHG